MTALFPSLPQPLAPEKPLLPNNTFLQLLPNNTFLQYLVVHRFTRATKWSQFYGANQGFFVELNH